MKDNRFENGDCVQERPDALVHLVIYTGYRSFETACNGVYDYQPAYIEEKHPESYLADRYRPQLAKHGITCFECLLYDERVRASRHADDRP